MQTALSKNLDINNLQSNLLKQQWHYYVVDFFIPT